DWTLPFGTKPSAINPRFFRGLLYPDPWFGRKPRQSLEVLIFLLTRPYSGHLQEERRVLRPG
ncbi:MAG: hypothetical protein ACREYC_26805, partial [Gammaproteobacteria bacterium]